MGDWHDPERGWGRHLRWEGKAAHVGGLCLGGGGEQLGKEVGRVGLVRGLLLLPHSPHPALGGHQF